MATFDYLDLPLVYVPVKWPGVGAGPNGEGVAVEHHVDIQCQIFDRDELAEWIVAGTKDFSSKEERATHERATFRQVAKGWRNIKVGGRVPDFGDDANVDTLLRFPGFVNAFGQAYLDAWNARFETRSGNFAGSDAHGQAAEPTEKTTEGAKS